MVEVSLTVEPTQATGRLVWSSTEDFDSNAVEGASVDNLNGIKSPAAYGVTTSDGTVSGEASLSMELGRSCLLARAQ